MKNNNKSVGFDLWGDVDSVILNKKKPVKNKVKKVISHEDYEKIKQEHYTCEDLVYKLMVKDFIPDEIKNQFINESLDIQIRGILLYMMPDGAGKELWEQSLYYMDNNVPIAKMTYLNELLIKLREYVKVKKVDKDNFGEVTTPLELIAKMWDEIPPKVRKDPNRKYLDPTNGTGPFLAIFALKLMIELKDVPGYENEDFRYQHILENMLYACEIQVENMFLYMILMNPQRKFKMNIYPGSFLEKEFDEYMVNVWGVDGVNQKFITIGNPPYNGEKGETNNYETIYPYFIEKSYYISDMMLMIIPSRWFVQDKDEKIKEFRHSMLNKYGLKSLRHYQDHKFFKNNDIKGGVSYFFTEKGYNGDVNFVLSRRKIGVDKNTRDKKGRERGYDEAWYETSAPVKKDFKSSGVILLQDFNTIHKKIIEKCGITFADRYRRNGHINTNDSRLQVENKTGMIPCLASRGRTLYLNPDDFSSESTYLNSHKVVTPLAQGEGYNLISKFTYLEPGIIANSSYILFEFVSKLEAKMFIEFLNTKTILILISLQKATQSLNSKCFQYVPVLDMKRKWTDEDIFDYFDFSIEERNSILDTYNEMTDSIEKEKLNKVEKKETILYSNKKKSKSK